MVRQDELQSLPGFNSRRLGAISEPRRVLDVNEKDFDDIVKHFGQRAFQMGIMPSSRMIPISERQIATPVAISHTAPPRVSATELIARQQTFVGRIPPLAKDVIVAWAIFNLTWIFLSLLRII